MIIAVMPMFSVSDKLNADSNYVFLKHLLIGVLKKRPDWYFLYLFPTDHRFKYYPDGFFSNNHIIRVPYDFSISKKKAVMDFPVKWWDDFLQKWPVDIIQNNIVEITHNLKALNQTYTEDAMFNIINQHHYILHKSLAYASTMKTDRGLALNQLSGSVMGDINIFNSNYCQKMLNENFEYFWGKKPEYKSEVIYFGVEAQEEKPKAEKLTFIYNHRLQDYKNWRDTFEVFDILSKKYDFQVLVTGVNNQYLSEVQRRKYTLIREKMYSHQEYLDTISVGHINITNSSHETFCISAMESMAFGQVLVAPRGVTFPELIPANYPYLFANQSEQVKMIESLIIDKQTRQEWGRRVRLNVLDKFSIDIFVDKWISVFERFLPEKLINLETLRKKDNLDQFINIVKAEKKELPYHLLRIRLMEVLGGKQAFPPVRLKRLLNLCGFADKITNGTFYLSPPKTGLP